MSVHSASGFESTQGLLWLTTDLEEKHQHLD